MNREFSAGGVVYKRSLAFQAKKNGADHLWLIARSAPTSDYPASYWRLPKGWIDDLDGGKYPGSIASGQRKATEEELREAALREVKEEGGVEAVIIQKLGTEQYVFKKNEGKVLKFVTFYLMEWERNIEEGPGFETAEIGWFPYEEARKILKNSGEKKILDRAKAIFTE
jgi:8-oxo-dGTP pyrophosphatase MutT (NUDIX family)